MMIGMRGNMILKTRKQISVRVIMQYDTIKLFALTDGVQLYEAVDKVEQNYI